MNDVRLAYFQAHLAQRRSEIEKVRNKILEEEMVKRVVRGRKVGERETGRKELEVEKVAREPNLLRNIVYEVARRIIKEKDLFLVRKFHDGDEQLNGVATSASTETKGQDKKRENGNREDGGRARANEGGNEEVEARTAS